MVILNIVFIAKKSISCRTVLNILLRHFVSQSVFLYYSFKMFCLIFTVFCLLSPMDSFLVYFKRILCLSLLFFNLIVVVAWISIKRSVYMLLNLNRPILWENLLAFIYTLDYFLYNNILRLHVNCYCHLKR